MDPEVALPAFLPVVSLASRQARPVHVFFKFQLTPTCLLADFPSDYSNSFQTDWLTCLGQKLPGPFFGGDPPLAWKSQAWVSTCRGHGR